MDKKNRILLLVDFSENSENKIDFAMRMSEIIAAEVLFIHILPEIPPTMSDEQTRQEMIRTETEKASIKLRELTKGKISEDAFLITSKPILSALEDLSDEAYFDWVLAGLKGTGALKRILVGSTTISIIDEGDLLTLAVPSHTHFSVPEKLLIGIHPKFDLNKHQLNIVLSSLNSHIKHLEFFTVLKNGEDETQSKEYLQSLQEEYKNYAPEIQVLHGDDTLGVLQSRVENTEDSFLVLQEGTRMITDKLFRKFTVNELIYSAKVPLIVLARQD